MKLLFVTIKTCLECNNGFFFVFGEGQKLSWCLSIETFVNQVDKADLRPMLITRVIIGPFRRNRYSCKIAILKVFSACVLGGLVFIYTLFFQVF